MRVVSRRAASSETPRCRAAAARAAQAGAQTARRRHPAAGGGEPLRSPVLGDGAGRRPPTTIEVPLSAAQRTNMRASTGSISKALAAAATLVASVAVPALAIQVGALDALGFGAVVQAPQTPSGEVVVAATPAPHHAVVEVRPAVSKTTPVAASTVSVVARSGAAPGNPPEEGHRSDVRAEDRRPARACPRRRKRRVPHRRRARRRPPVRRRLRQRRPPRRLPRTRRPRP